jgi:transposase
MSTRFYETDLTDAAWAWVAPVLPAARPGGRPRTTNLRAVLNAIFYLLRTGCQWRLLPREFPPCGTVYRSTITFKPGKAPACGSIYIECSTSRPVVMPDGQLVHRW